MKRRSAVLAGMMIFSVAVLVQPSWSATLFGLVDTGELFISTDGGTTWGVQSMLPVSDAVAIAAGESSQELFMATRSGSMYRSTDGGTIWTAIGSVSANDVIDMGLRVNGDIFLLSETGTLWLSTDTGANFTVISTLTASNHVSFASDVAGGNMFVLTRTGEVSRSSDFGMTWMAVGAITTSDAVAIRAVGLDLYVLTGTGDIIRSQSHGVRWMAVGTISQVHMAGLTTNGTDLVAATEEGLVATSNDAVSWAFSGSINQLTVVAIGNDSPRVVGIRDQVPVFSGIRLRSLWPNPARASGEAISVLFELANPGQVELRVYDVAGSLVAERASRLFAEPGEHTIRWSPGDLPSGVYLVRLITESGLRSQTKLTIIR